MPSSRFRTSCRQPPPHRATVLQVAELSQELQQAWHGEEGPLTDRERLWKEKEAAGDEEGDSGSGGQLEVDRRPVDPDGGSSSSSGRGAWDRRGGAALGALEAFRQRQQQGWDQALQQQAQQLLEPRRAVPRPGGGGWDGARRAFELTMQPPPRPDPEVVKLSKEEEERWEGGRGLDLGVLVVRAGTSRFCHGSRGWG